MASNEDREYGQPTRLPIPDPTVLTTEALRRDIGSLRELLEEKIAAEHNLTQNYLAERELRYEQRFMAQEKAVNAALIAQKEAVVKQEMASEKRFEGVNEFRAQLSDQAATFLPRNEYQVQHDSLNEKVDAVTKNVAERMDLSSKAINQAISNLQISRATDEGHSSGLNAGWVLFAGGAGLLIGIVGILLRIFAK